MRLQRFDEHQKMPWKNGLGITREVAIHGPEEGASFFLWRISLASVSGSGPFSVFPGVDRTIAVLAGDGMQLTVDGVEQPPLTQNSEPYAFSGDATVHADSIGGETTDLNIMTRRGRFSHNVTKMVCETAATIAVTPATVAIVFGGPAGVTTPDGRVALGCGDVLLDLQPGEELHIDAEAQSSAFFLVSVAEKS